MRWREWRLLLNAGGRRWFGEFLGARRRLELRVGLDRVTNLGCGGDGRSRRGGGIEVYRIEDLIAAKRRPGTGGGSNTTHWMLDDHPNGAKSAYGLELELKVVVLGRDLAHRKLERPRVKDQRRVIGGRPKVDRLCQMVGGGGVYEGYGGNRERCSNKPEPTS